MDYEKLETLGTVQVSTILRAIESCKKNCPELSEDFSLSFEYVIASFFPNIYQKMLVLLKDEHTQGYIEGYNDGIKENKE